MRFSPGQKSHHRNDRGDERDRRDGEPAVRGGRPVRPVERRERAVDQSRRGKDHRRGGHGRNFLHHARADDDVDRIDRRRANRQQDAHPLAALRIDDQRHARRRQRQCNDFDAIEFFLQEDDREDRDEGGIEIQQQRHQTRRGVLRGGKKTKRLAHIPDRAHADQQRQRLAARHAFSPHDENPAMMSAENVKRRKSSVNVSSPSA